MRTLHLLTIVSFVVVLGLLLTTLSQLSNVYPSYLSPEIDQNLAAHLSKYDIKTTVKRAKQARLNNVFWAMQRHSGRGVAVDFWKDPEVLDDFFFQVTPPSFRPLMNSKVNFSGTPLQVRYLVIN